MTRLMAWSVMPAFHQKSRMTHTLACCKFRPIAPSLNVISNTPFSLWPNCSTSFWRSADDWLLCMRKSGLSLSAKCSTRLSKDWKAEKTTTRSAGCLATSSRHRSSLLERTLLTSSRSQKRLASRYSSKHDALTTSLNGPLSAVVAITTTLARTLMGQTNDWRRYVIMPNNAPPIFWMLRPWALSCWMRCQTSVISRLSAM